MKNGLGLEGSERSKIEYREEEFKDLIEGYKKKRKMLGEDYIVKSEVVLIKKGLWKCEGDMIIGEIERRLRVEGEL